MASASVESVNSVGISCLIAPSRVMRQILWRAQTVPQSRYGRDKGYRKGLYLHVKLRRENDIFCRKLLTHCRREANRHRRLNNHHCCGVDADHILHDRFHTGRIKIVSFGIVIRRRSNDDVICILVRIKLIQRCPESDVIFL